MQQNSKPAKRRQNVLLLSVSHCTAVTIWGQPFKKLPQIHLCTIDCFEALCKTVVTVFFHYYCKSCGAGAIEEQRSRRRRSAQLRVWAFAVLPPASRLEGQKQAELLLFLLNPFGRRSNLLTQETTKKGFSFSRPWNCSLFSSINPKSIIFTVLFKPLHSKFTKYCRVLNNRTSSIKENFLSYGWPKRTIWYCITNSRLEYQFECSTC